jgi:hypothetical protein
MFELAMQDDPGSFLLFGDPRCRLFGPNVSLLERPGQKIASTAKPNEMHGVL